MISRLKGGTKLNKSSFLNDNITIDAKHNEMINYFKNLQDSTPVLKEELKKLIAEYNNKDPSKKNDIEYILYRDGLKDKINEIKNKINSISNNEELNKYYLDVGILLHSYYENIEKSKSIKNNSENFEENLLNYDQLSEDDEYIDVEYNEDSDDNEVKPKKENYKSVLNFFNNREENKELEDNDSENQSNNDSNDNQKNDGLYTSMKISDFVKKESTFKKKDALDEYLQKIDPKYVSRIKIDTNICKCSNCNIEMTLYPSDGIQICENCGNQENILIESDKPSFKDPPLEVCYFSYKRINHYNEYIGQKVYINDFIKVIYKIIYFLIN
jgi:hypothetical protein